MGSREQLSPDEYLKARSEEERRTELRQSYMAKWFDGRFWFGASAALIRAEEQYVSNK